MSRGTLVLLLLVLGLGGFYYFYDVRGGEERKTAEKQEKRLFAELSADSMSGLEVTGADEKSPSLVLEKRGRRWVRKGPPEQLMSVREVGGVADKLVDLERDELILEAPKPEELKQFGLEKPSHRLIVKGGAKTSTLLVGERTPDGSSFYVRTAPDGPVVTVPGTFAALLEKTPEALRELSVLPGDMSKAVKVRLLRGGQETELEMNVTHREEEKDEDSFMSFLEGDWNVTKPFQAPADGSKVSAYLNEWGQKRAGRFLAPDEKVDFSRPELRLEVWEDGQSTPQVLEVGPPVQVQPTMRYVRRLEPEEVMVVDFTRTELLSREAEFFRDRHLFALKDPGEIEKIEGRLGSRDFEASRSGDGWKVVKPSGGDREKQSAALTSFMWEVSEAQSTGPAPAGAVTGLDNPRARITLFKAKGENLGTLLVGAQTPDKKGCYVQLEGKPEAGVSEQDYAARWEELLEPLWPAAPSPSASP